MDATDTLDVNLFDAEVRLHDIGQSVKSCLASHSKAKTLFGCSAAEYNNTWELARDSANEDCALSAKT
eukprot:5166918-Amphidinium_carterae.2